MNLFETKEGRKDLCLDLTPGQLFAAYVKQSQANISFLNSMLKC